MNTTQRAEVAATAVADTLTSVRDAALRYGVDASLVAMAVDRKLKERDREVVKEDSSQ